MKTIYAKPDGRGGYDVAPLAYENGSVTSPGAATHAAHGYYPLSVEPPPHRDGFANRVKGYEIVGGKCVALFEQVEVTPAPRRWTPLAIKRSAVALGRWDDLREFLVEANAYDDFVMAQYEAEDDADFARLMAAARERFGDAIVDAILDGAEEG